MEHKLGSRLLREISVTSDRQQRRQWHPTPVLLPGKSHGQRSLVGCSPWRRKESDTTERLHFHFSLSYIGEGNGNRLQCSWLENPRDGGVWWAATYGVTQSQTRLKWLSSSSRYADGTTLMAQSEEELKSLLMKVKEENENVGLKLNIQKTKIMASGPIISWPINGETVETVTDCILRGSKITADGDCSHEIKRRLLLRRKVRTNLLKVRIKHIKKQRHYLVNKDLLVKAVVFQ